MRRGTSLVEVLVAVAILAGPLLITFDLLRSASREARAVEQVETMRLALFGAMEVVAGETTARIRHVLLPENRAELENLVDGFLREGGRDEASAGRAPRRDWTVRGALVSAPGGAAGVVMLELSAVRASGETATLRRLFRQRGARAVARPPGGGKRQRP